MCCSVAARMVCVTALYGAFLLIILLVISLGILSKLERMKGIVMQCRQSLMILVERKRQHFPRFYFISLEDILHVLSCGMILYCILSTDVGGGCSSLSLFSI